MSRYSLSNDPKQALCFCLKYMSLRCTSAQKGIVQLLDGKPIAAVCYDMFMGDPTLPEPNGSVLMHVAADTTKRWITRDLLRWSFNYPFNQLRVSICLGLVSANNPSAQRLNEHLGFKQQAVIPGADVGGHDLIIYGLRREDCRYV